MHKSLTERDRQVIWHPYTQMKGAPEPLPIVKGEGVYLIDESGNRYIDAISNWWVTLHGHGHPYLAQKIYEQARELEQVIFAGFTHEPAVQLAERLLEILPAGMSKVFFSDNGSTAVEVAIKMAIQYWKNREGAQEASPFLIPSSRDLEKAKPLPLPLRKKILSLSNAYHGDTFGAMSVSGRGLFTLPFEDYLFEVEAVDISEWGMVSSEWAERLSSAEFACFIYEPLVQGAGGMKMYEAERLNDLLKLCRQHGILCIADEVMTGFGRTGKLFASEYLDVQPDIICLSKGLTGGMMALGATVCTQAIYDAFLSDDKSKTFFHGHSYTANPIACAAGNASLDLLLQDDCRNNIEKIISCHKEFALELSQSKHAKNIRQTGTILAFEIETNSNDGYLNNISSIIHKKALQQGVLLRPLGNTVYVMPPYCIINDELNKVYAVIIDIIDKL
ncbi:MAG: aspartate aminotransferase family protein [Chitinophagaceae bacterium]